MCSEIKQMILFFFAFNINCFFKIIFASPVVVNNSHHHNASLPVIVEVPYGKTVTLICHSNDNNHNFIYWFLNEKNTIVGPGNDDYDLMKFKYEVLSGNLTIKGVSEAEEGFYNCVSRGVRKNDYNVRTTRMIVQKDWEDVYEHDPGVNLFRAVVVIGTLMVIAGVGYVAYRIWKDRYRNPSYLVPSEDEEDDSGDEIFRAPGTSRTSGNIVKTNVADTFEGPGISTDFKSILDTANSK